MGTTSLTNISSTVTTLSLGSTSTTTSGGIAFQVNSVVKAYNYVANNYLINQTVSGIGQIFYGAGSEQMRIHNTTGNVGIGTTNPNANLEVAGSTRITGGGLDVGYGNNGTNYVQVGYGRTTNGYALIDLIGDSTYTDYGFRILRNNSGPNTDTDIIHRGTGDLDLKTVDAGDIGFHTTSIQRMIVKSSGSVGIGTTLPSQKLEVAGEVLIKNGTLSYLYLNNTSNFLYGDTYGNTIIRSSNNFRIQTKTGGGESVRVTSAGNVGIGTTTANVRLEIGGGSSLARVIPSISNQGYIGDSQHFWQAIYATNGTIQTSDIREKTEIKPTKLGLDFINDLNPVSYKWIEGERLDASKDERNHQGLIAQEVAKTLEKHGVDKNKFGGLDIQKTDEYDDFHAMSYEQLIAPMIKAIQELKAEIEKLKKQINK